MLVSITTVQTDPETVEKHTIAMGKITKDLLFLKLQWLLVPRNLFPKIWSFYDFLAYRATLRTVIFTPIERLWSPLTESQQPVCLNRNYLHKTKNKLSRKINFMLMLIQMSSTHSRLFSLFRLLGRILILKITQFISWSTYIKGSPHHSPWRWLLNTGSTELLISPRSGAEVAKPDWRWRFHHSFSIHDSNRVWESKYLLIKSSFRHYHLNF